MMRRRMQDEDESEDEGMWNVPMKDTTVSKVLTNVLHQDEKKSICGSGLLTDPIFFCRPYYF